MAKLAFIAAAASLFALGPVASRIGPAGSSLALVGLGVLVAICASEAVSAFAVALGALGAFGAGILGGVSPAAAGAVIVTAAFAERVSRVRSQRARACHVLLGLAGGALAGSLTAAFTAPTSVFAVAVVVAAVASSLPFLVDADDHVAHALVRAAKSVPGPVCSALVRAAELRRHAGEVPIDRRARPGVKKTWQSLLRLAGARIRVERAQGGAGPFAPERGPEAELSAAAAVVAMLDQRIHEHVTALGKAITAVDTAHAAALGLEDTNARTTDAMGDSLEDVSRALVDV